LSSEHLASILTRETLRALAGERSFSRGEAYAADQRVEGLTEDGECLVAEVCGTREYHVELWVEDGALACECDCPVGMDGACCKHCVAVGLTWLDQRKNIAPHQGSPSASPAVTLEDVRAYLRTLTPETLVELMMTQVHHDPDLREQMLLRVARASAQGIDLPTYRKAIDRAVALRDFLDYGGTADYASDVSRVLDSLEELLQDGHGEEALALIEYAVRTLDQSVGQVDDSDGYLGSEIERLQELHYRACEAVHPDPDALAHQLFTWELENDYVEFSGSAAVYAELLGDDGLATVRALVEAEWARLPALAPGQSDANRYGKRWRITNMMESLARASGDVDAVVAVKSRDLSHAYAFYQIAQLYQDAGRHDDALAWAERGRQAFPERTDARLRQFLIEEYHRRDRHDEAMAIVWQAFTESPALPAYQQLEDHAARIAQWPQWRERAWALLREQVASANTARSSPWTPNIGHSELVRILLWEGKLEEAWQEAVTGGCSADLWLQLADKRVVDYPEDALLVYQRQITPTLDQTNNDAYARAMGLLQKCRAIFIRLGRQEDFLRYVTALRAEYKRKRNFIKLLDAAKWS